MLDSLIAYLSAIQGGIVRALAAEMRAGGIGTAALAFSLGALHALTPGHGKAALAAYFLGREAHIGKGVHVALGAALLHVLSGFAVFLILRFVIEQTPSITGRGSPAFAAAGYSLIIVAGLILLYQSMRPARALHDGAGTLTAGVGLLPCPLTISVLGFAWFQGSAVMIGIVLLSLALGVSLTIGLTAVLAILARRGLGEATGPWLGRFERGGRILQGAAGTAIILIGILTIWSLSE